MFCSRTNKSLRSPYVCLVSNNRPSVSARLDLHYEHVGTLALRQFPHSEPAPVSIPCQAVSLHWCLLHPVIIQDLGQRKSPGAIESLLSQECTVNSPTFIETIGSSLRIFPTASAS
ncbi:pro-pol polyprotein [Plakobranchus ocellatus]|uniref:Pro-pol polyprotein n=1 Tax=Plakobranchus ocellatus TaxID=259542 RepID=A0AAV4AK80_9GAST|nr:pro-pol polyprotein [Plakobranchus ocellatus]